MTVPGSPLPVMRVLALCDQMRSVASTQLRVRLYSSGVG
jgi:hypothetical protein